MRNKTLYNSIVGFGCRLIILALGFVVPRVIMTHYGSDVNGFTNTMSQIFSYLALIEAGITGSTSVQLYKYIKDDNKSGMSYAMSVSRRYYRRIAKIYFLIVVVLSFLLPFILHTEIDYWTICFYMIFEGLTSVVSFYSVSLCQTFLNANGKAYIVNYIALLNKFMQYSVKIVLSFIGVNIAFIQIGYFGVSLLQLIIYSVYMHKHYDWIDYGAAPKEAKLPDRNSFLVTEIAYTIFSSTDMIVLSIFLTTSYSSVYSTYNMVFLAVETMITSVYNSIKYNLGRTYHQNLECYCHLHDLYNSIFIGICATLMCVTYILMLPFIKIYTEGVTDINYMYQYLPLMFCLVRLLSRSRSVAGNISGIAGYAKPVSYVSLLEAIINVVLSIILVNRFGIYGVLFATLVALPIKVIYLTWLAEKKIMKRTGWKSVKIIGINFLLLFIAVAVNKMLNITVNSYSAFMLYGFILLVIFGILSYLLNGIVNPELFDIIRKKKCR